MVKYKSQSMKNYLIETKEIEEEGGAFLAIYSSLQ